jgi:hypothetical protein
MTCRRALQRALIASALVTVVATAGAQTPAPAAPAQSHDVAELARKTQNPISDLVSLPFQFNFNSGGAFAESTGLNLNFQPVIPFSVSAHWNAIARVIVPINSLPTGPGTRQSGFGDTQGQLFFSPKTTGSFIWGAGPMMSMPTATMSAVETGSWTLGPGAVVVQMTGPWVLGGLFQQFWTFADSGDARDVNLFVFQPFINYNFGKGWALAFAPIVTADWNADGDEWTVPAGLGITRTTVFSGRPMNIGVQYYYNVTKPDSAAGNTLRFVIALLYPSKK